MARLRLSATHFDTLPSAGRYVTLDAAHALAQMVDGYLDEAAFDRVIGGTMREAAMQSESGFVFALGEMVAPAMRSGQRRKRVAP
jgi:hypothetical protein